MDYRNARVLVSSAVEATWPTSRPVVFLGEWCLRYSRKDVWSAIDYEVLPYHWDDRHKIPADLEYISNVYEAPLPELADALNRLHGVDYSLRYWRIVVGWWLFYFAQIVFDRWSVLRQAEISYPNAYMMRMPAEPSIPASDDTDDFLRASTTDFWNERLFADIAENWTAIRIQIVDELPEIQPRSVEDSSRNLIRSPSHSMRSRVAKVIHGLG